MYKRIVFIIALFLILPLCAKAEDINCRYSYKPLKTVDVIFDVYYSSDAKKPKYTIVSDESKFSSEFVEFNLSNDDFTNDKGNVFCPTIYVSYLVNNSATQLHVHNKYSQGLTGVSANKVNSNSGNVGNKTTNITTTIKADLFDSNCRDFADTLKIGGVIILIIKIALPLILIVRTSFDLLSIVTKGDPEEFKKKLSKLGVSILSATLIFFTPMIVNTIFGLITNMRGVESTNEDMEICRACLFEPLSGKCSSGETQTGGN